MALRKLQEDLLTVMKQIQRDGPKDPKSGICHNVLREMPFAVGVYSAMENLFQTWDKFSGSNTFPIPADNPDETGPDDVYLTWTGNMWDKNTGYGHNRWALLEHCITQLEIQLSKT